MVRWIGSIAITGEGEPAPREALWPEAVAFFGDGLRGDGEVSRYAPFQKPFDGDYTPWLRNGPNQPRPTLTAYPGYDGPMADRTYYLSDPGQWVNCVTGEVHEYVAMEMGK